MGKNREKVTLMDKSPIPTGYYDENNQFVLHSFNDEPALIYANGNKYWHKDNLQHRDYDLPAVIFPDGKDLWYDHGDQYWIIENTKYFNIDEVNIKFKDKILKFNYDISQHLTDNNINFICLNYCNGYRYLILDDGIDKSLINEWILKYG